MRQYMGIEWQQTASIYEKVSKKTETRETRHIISLEIFKSREGIGALHCNG